MSPQPHPSHRSEEAENAQDLAFCCARDAAAESGEPLPPMCAGDCGRELDTAQEQAEGYCVVCQQERGEDREQDRLSDISRGC